jgi:hypothetical protein
VFAGPTEEEIRKEKPGRARRRTHRASKAVTTLAKSAKPAALPAGLLKIKGRTVTLPLSWFMKPLLDKMKETVRPPTASTRRAERKIELQMPAEVFFHLLSPFEDGELPGLKWTDNGYLEPTSTASKAYLEYKYLVTVPSHLNRLWALENIDKPRKTGAWHRGLGASKLHLSIAAQERGTRSSLLSTVCGNVELRLLAPRNEAAMPTARILFKVLTMDNKGHVIWPTDFGPKTKAALRKMAKSNLQKMVINVLYPTEIIAPALTTTTDTEATWTAPPQQPRLH